MTPAIRCAAAVFYRVHNKGHVWTAAPDASDCRCSSEGRRRAFILRTWNNGATLSQDTKAWPPNCVSSGSPPFSTISWHILRVRAGSGLVLGSGLGLVVGP